MKGLILAAGMGTRLRPLTYERSKPMVPVANRPLISYPLEQMTDIGIRDVGIVVGQNRAELERDLDGRGAKLSFIDQPEPKGLAHAVQCAQEYCGDDEFVLMFCDNLFSEPLDNSLALWNKLRKEEPKTECLIHVLEVDDPRAFGVAIVDGGGWVTDMEEKPKEPRSNLAVLGIDFLTPRIFEAIPRIKPSHRGELEITDAIIELVHMGYKVHASKLDGFWYDTGTFGDLIDVLKPVLDARQHYSRAGATRHCTMSGRVGIEEGSVVADTMLHGPMVIGKGCQVTACELGPYVSVGDGCVLEGCKLKNAQLLPGTKLYNVEDSEVIYDGKERITRDTEPAK